MKTEYIKYLEYKKPDVSFIDSIPSHWETWKVTHGYGTIGSGTTPKSDNPDFYNGDIPWITTSELRETVITDTSQKITELALEKVSSLKMYNSGAIAIAMYGATIGRLGILGIESTVNQACCVYDNPKEFYSKFLYYWLWMSRNTLIAFSSGGGQPNLSQDDLKQLRIPIPKVQEQTQIASFLDQKTAQIDKLIAQKEKLLKLLAEKRTAIITQAVTKGLDPNVEMKDSGIVWLGEIPKDWDIKKIKYITSKVGDGLHGTPEYTDNTEYFFINGNNLGNGSITITPQTRTISEEQYLENDKKLNSQTILLSINGTIGNVAFYKGETVMLGKSAAYIKFNESINTNYLRWFMESSIFENYFELELTGTTIKNLSLESIKNTPVVFPTETEQTDIVTYIETITERLDKILKDVKSSIAQLKEYREALITAAVTGQIDVRKEASHE